MCSANTFPLSRFCRAAIKSELYAYANTEEITKRANGPADMCCTWNKLPFNTALFNSCAFEGVVKNQITYGASTTVS